MASVALFSLALLCCRHGFAAVFDILITDDAVVTRIVLDRDLTFTVDGNNLVFHIPDTSVNIGDDVTTDGTGDTDGTDSNDGNDGDNVTEGSEDPDSTGVNEGEGVTDGSENPEGNEVTDDSNITDETDGNLSSEANDAEDESEGSVETDNAEDTDETDNAEDTEKTDESKEIIFPIESLKSIKYVAHEETSVSSNVSDINVDNELRYRVLGKLLYVNSPIENNRISVYTQAGIMVVDKTFNGEISLSLSDLVAGMYLVQVNNRKAIKILVK
jgi:hypothetical protein